MEAEFQLTVEHDGKKHTFLVNPRSTLKDFQRVLETHLRAKLDTSFLSVCGNVVHFSDSRFLRNVGIDGTSVVVLKPTMCCIRVRVTEGGSHMVSLSYDLPVSALKDKIVEEFYVDKLESQDILLLDNNVEVSDSSLIFLFHDQTLEMRCRTQPVPLVLPTTIRIIKGTKPALASLLRRLDYSCDVNHTSLKGRPVVIQTFTKASASFILNSEAKEFLSSFSGDYHVIAITGPLRSGKSTLTTLMLRHMTKNPRHSFDMGSGELCCTVGIWMWPQLVEWRGKRFLLLDVEGLYNRDKISGNSEEYYLKLFTISSIISSMLIFNCNMNTFAADSRLAEELTNLITIQKHLDDDQTMTLVANSPQFVLVGRNYTDYRDHEEDEELWYEFLSDQDENFRKNFEKLFPNNTFVSMKSLILENTHNDWTLDTLQETDINPEFQEKFNWFMKGILLSEKLKPLQIVYGTQTQKTTIHVNDLYGVLSSLIERMTNEIRIDFRGAVNIIKAHTVDQKIDAVRERVTNFLSEKAEHCAFQWEIFQSELEKKVWEEVVALAKEIYESGLKDVVSSGQECLRHQEPPPDESYRLVMNSVMLSRVATLKMSNDTKIYQVLEAYGREKESELSSISDQSKLESWKTVNNVPNFLATQAQESLITILNNAKDRAERASVTCLVDFGKNLLSVATRMKSPEIIKTPQDVEDYIQNLTPCESTAFLKAVETRDKNYMSQVIWDYDLNVLPLPPLFLRANMKEDLEKFTLHLKETAEKCRTKFKDKEYEQMAVAFLANFLDVTTLPKPPQPFSVSTYLKALASAVEAYKEYRPYSLHARLDAASLRVKKEKYESLTSSDIQKFVDDLRPSWDCHLLSPDFKVHVTVDMAHMDEAQIKERLGWISNPIRILAKGNCFECTFRDEVGVQGLMQNERLPWIQKISRSKTSRVLVKNGRSLVDPKTLDQVLKSILLSDVSVLELVVYQDYCCLALDRQDAVEELLKVPCFKLPTTEKMEFMEPVKNQVTSEGLARIEKFVIHKEKLEKNLFLCETFPLPFVEVQLFPIEFLNLKFEQIVDAENLLREKAFYKDPTSLIWDGSHFARLLNNATNNSDYIHVHSLRVIAGALTKKISELRKYSVLLPELIAEKNNTVSQLVSKDPGLLKMGNTIQLPSPEPTQSVVLTRIDSRRSENTRVSFDFCDTLVAAKRYVEREKKVLVLNMANDKRPGGWWTLGELGQEEELFRRTNLSASLSPSHYPLGRRSSLFTANVSVFRGVSTNGYSFMERPFLIDVISSAAYDNSQYDLSEQEPLTNEVVFKESIVQGTFHKIQNIIHFAAQNRYDVIILGAIGCGAFNNPPGDVAKIFHEVFSIYAGAIPEIKFAILHSETFAKFERCIKTEYWSTGSSLPAPIPGFTDMCTPECPEGVACKIRNHRIHAACVHQQKHHGAVH
eukprot:TRINITY_DN6444_c0_g1_i1.p1 TRINITY_DN6444_c0_g1~~TRINITY_DN6444_c0_g1_i1.p1  ORF type:complete len:1432 (-),score=234.43 TRINITY_DN6444_c0_g1_i1:52-4347(-)